MTPCPRLGLFPRSSRSTASGRHVEMGCRRGHFPLPTGEPWGDLCALSVHSGVFVLCFPGIPEGMLEAWPATALGQRDRRLATITCFHNVLYKVWGLSRRRALSLQTRACVTRDKKAQITLSSAPWRGVRLRHSGLVFCLLPFSPLSHVFLSPLLELFSQTRFSAALRPVSLAPAAHGAETSGT